MSHDKTKLMRRDFLRAAGVGAFGLCSMGWLRFAIGQSAIRKINLQRNYAAGRYYFDPIGLYVTRGQIVQWFSRREGFSVTAYHPDNDNHELRIPQDAKPFDSGILPVGTSFEWTFDVEGTYDYYSQRHEVIGMVGRIVVGSPGGPGEKPLGYGSGEGRAPIFKEVIRAFAFVRPEEIVSKKLIPYPVKELERRFPLY
ncbi:plastocyanin/azurin family copper-binding protein [Acidobacteria bacterium AH-259-D05]|nr:plastocyanin/azurin family copper-binding protein [Acidobacteria bacterium AH-259-D05]